ncbi:PRP1 splicing factor, N-terminal-domain-containing protein [Mycena epipterygia]|nr:PRP1 splicing factor, N-terminal-domain-containing protein [Mycena epipterygia]
MASKDRLSFLSMPAPASYVAGLGRGASGFTTRSDIGPAREWPSQETIAAQDRIYDSEVFQDPETEAKLFSVIKYEADDDAADEVFEKIDREMGSRRKSRKQAQATQKAAPQQTAPKIQTQFSDLKRGLSTVTDEEWESIPEVSNLTKCRKAGDTRSYVVLDSILVADRNRLGLETSLSAYQQAQYDQLTGSKTATSDIVELGAARDKLLSLKLDQASAFLVSASASSINSEDYLTNLDSAIIRTDAEIGDIKKARLLFDSMVKSNPKYAPGWIASACVEEHAGRMVAARKLINSGCLQCPNSEEIWLEAARLHNTGDAKIILANAIQHVHQSVKIWLKARQVLRKALESIPNSVILWKEAVNLETSPSDARLLLARAVELIPQAVELWLALARLEPLEQAKAVLNKAGATNPTSIEPWIAAAHLIEKEAQESPVNDEGNTSDAIDHTIATAVHTIATAVHKICNRGVSFTREQWLEVAERSDEVGMPLTCSAIIKSTIAMDVEPQDQIRTWLGDIENMQSKGRVATARAIAAYTLKVFPDRADIWEKAIEIEDFLGASSSRDILLEHAVAQCPNAEALWLMWAQKKWADGDVPGARDVLNHALNVIAGSERIWLMTVKLEVESGKIGVARTLLLYARDTVDTGRLWMKAAVFERQQGNLNDALSITDTGLSKFPTFAKLYMIQGQIHDSLGRTAAARASFSAGLRACSNEPKLWILASRLEEKDNKSIKARSLLEKARLVLPGNELLWAEAVHVEERSGAATAAKSVLARGLQACPASGYLWSMMVWSEPRATRKLRTADAMIKSGKHPSVLCTVARLFWTERKIDKARDWFSRATDAATADGLDIGDIWAWWLDFEREYGTQDQQLAVISACSTAAPKHGRVWESISKEDANVLKGVAEILELVSAVIGGDKV